MVKNEVMKLDGRYALVKRPTAYQKYVVACGYDRQRGDWGHGIYFSDYKDAEKEFYKCVREAKKLGRYN